MCLRSPQRALGHIFKEVTFTGVSLNVVSNHYTSLLTFNMFSRLKSWVSYAFKAPAQPALLGMRLGPEGSTDNPLMVRHRRACVISLSITNLCGYLAAVFYLGRDARVYELVEAFRERNPNPGEDGLYPSLASTAEQGGRDCEFHCKSTLVLSNMCQTGRGYDAYDLVSSCGHLVHMASVRLTCC